MENHWRCKKCKTLLGVIKRGKIYLRYQEVQYIVEGLVIAVCRKCHTVNEAES